MASVGAENKSPFLPSVPKNTDAALLWKPDLSFTRVTAFAQPPHGAGYEANAALIGTPSTPLGQKDAGNRDWNTVFITVMAINSMLT